MEARGQSVVPAEEEEHREAYKVTLIPALLACLHREKRKVGEAWSLTPLIPALKKLRQEDCHKCKRA